MRTLKEMESDLEKIEQDIKTISEIASLARPYTYVDLTAWNALIPATAGRINALMQNLSDAVDSVGGYARQVAFDVRRGKFPVNDAEFELYRACEIARVIDSYNKSIQDQIVRFNAYQKQVLERVGGTK